MAYPGPILILNVLRYHTYIQMVKDAIKSPQWYGVYTLRGIQYILKNICCCYLGVIGIFRLHLCSYGYFQICNLLNLIVCHNYHGRRQLLLSSVFIFDTFQSNFG